MKTKNLQKNELLTGKLLSYSAAAGALLAIGQDAEAQVAYTDVDPDSICIAPEVDSASIFAIDMNGDEIVDVTIVAGNGDWYYDTTTPKHWVSVRAMPGDAAELATQTSFITVEGWGTYTFAKRFDADDLIGSDLGTENTWRKANGSSYSYSWQLGFDGTSYEIHYNYGAWNDGETDKYLGIRFSLDEGASFHYGWVRLDVAEDHSQVTVKGYAYEQTADKAIAAGDMGSGTSVRDGLSETGVKIFSAHNAIVISDLKADRAQAEIFNLTGQLVRSVQVEKGRTQIAMEDTGLFIVRVDTGAGVISGKVIVQ